MHKEKALNHNVIEGKSDIYGCLNYYYYRTHYS